MEARGYAEDYYSSDEEVCWGRYTLREAKRDVREGLPRKIDRRHTFGGNKIIEENSKLKTARAYHKEPVQEVANLSQQMDAKLNISATSSSDYLTPNETFKGDATSGSDLLDKIKKIIDEPTDDSYTTAIDRTNNPEDRSGRDYSILNLIKKSRQESRDSKMLENVRQTLVENTIILSSDEEEINLSCIKEEMDSIHSSFNHSYETQSRNPKLDSVIEIDSSSNSLSVSDSEVANLVDVSTSKSYSKEEYYDSLNGDRGSDNSSKEQVMEKESEMFSSLESHSEKPVIDEIITALSEDLDQHALERNSMNEDFSNQRFKHSLRQNDFDHDESEYSVQEENYEVEESSVCNGNNADVSSDSDLSRLEDIDVKSHENSAEDYKVPDIHVQSYESSVKNCSAVSFDDTLEEIQMAMKFGLDYKMPGESECEEVSSNSDNKHHDYDYFKKGDSLSPSNSVKSGSSCSKSGIPKLVRHDDYLRSEITPKKYFTPNSPSSVTKNSPHDHFKVPTKPVRTKVTPLKSPAVNKLKFKNIISPVGVYIKNSPSAVLTQKVVPKDLKFVRVEKPAENRVLKPVENSELPEVVYKPAKTKILYKEKEIMLPKSIKKLVYEPTVIKHEGHIKHKKLDSDVIKAKLLQEDLTCASIDDSVLTEGGDVSIWTEKAGFK